MWLCETPCQGGPWTPEAVRQAKGFNAVLLMTVQPDMDCVGPRSRTEDLGFDVGFEDLPKGTLRQLRPEYFQMIDRLAGILVAHGIAPVCQPVFHGYGWRGRRTAGNVVSAEDYARYCRHLVARYGARPAIWLVGGDGPGTDPFVIEQLDRAVRAIEEWDAYRQPTGIHYSPHALYRTHPDKAWLDFQWRLHAKEPDHADWCTAPGAGWHEALDFEGSRYPGIAAKIFDGLPFADMQPNWTYTYGRRGLALPGKLFVLYLPEGGSTGITSLDVPRAYRVLRSGGRRGGGQGPVAGPGAGPV